ncbi:MAG: GTPase Era [Desulfobulbaceae bacterium]|nr:GTPase Era [Desulfobulbaceae bacterium]
MSGSVYRSGVVAIVGPPNAGKSTLLNHFLQQKIAIVTPRPQTTRNRILGIVTGPDYQMIMLDTPGLHQAREMLNREMVRIALESLAEADVVLFLAEASAMTTKKLEKHRNEYSGYLGKVRRPSILALNKIDLVKKEQLLPVIDWYNSLHSFSAVVPISALHGEGTELLLRELVTRLPEGPRYYPDDIPTDATERFIVAEIIREKIFLLTHEEVPYSTAVLIDSFKEGEPDRPVVIHATILVERGSQKGIIIGRRGKMLGEIRKRATKDIEHLLDCKVQLKLWIKIKKQWTKNERILRELGF